MPDETKTDTNRFAWQEGIPDDQLAEPAYAEAERIIEEALAEGGDEPVELNLRKTSHPGKSAQACHPEEPATKDLPETIARSAAV